MYEVNIVLVCENEELTVIRDKYQQMKIKKRLQFNKDEIKEFKRRRNTLIHYSIPLKMESAFMKMIDQKDKH